MPPNAQAMRLSTTKLCQCKRNKRGLRDHREQEYIDITSEQSDTHMIFSQPIPSINIIRQLHENQNFIKQNSRTVGESQPRSLDDNQQIPPGKRTENSHIFQISNHAASNEEISIPEQPRGLSTNWGQTTKAVLRR